VFNGSRFRAEIQPKIAAFIRAHQREEARALNGAVIRLPAGQNSTPERLADDFGLTALKPPNFPALTGDAKKQVWR
jgi:hypothetical protein